MDANLKSLLSKYPLPAEASAPELFCERVRVAELELGLVGLWVEIDGTQITGSAAEPGAPPLHRAYFELLERVNLMRVVQATEEPTRLRLLTARGEFVRLVERDEAFPASPNPRAFRPAFSNGVATGATYADAVARAWAEAVERDAMLKSWYGDLRLEPLPSSALGRWSSMQGLYELELRCVRWAAHWVVAAVGFPRDAGTPKCLAFAARQELEPANEAAHREFVQRLGFLWGEEIPSAEPTPTPAADYHQELYLWAGSEPWLRRWLDPGRVTRAAPQWEQPPPAEGFFELTPRELQGRLSIVKAHQPKLWPLLFGAGFDPPGAGQPGSVQPPHPVHPIA